MYNFQEISQPSFNANKLQKWYELLYALFIYYLIVTLCTIIILLTDFFVRKVLNHPSIYESHFNREEYIKAIGLCKSVFIITIVAPISEELSFRLLLNPTRFNTSFSIAFLLFSLSGPVWYYENTSNYLTRLTICIFFFFVIYLSCNFKYKYRPKITKNKLLLISSLCFGGFHISNFSPIYRDLFFFYPIYVSPQIALGFILGIIRIRNGFIWAIALHVLVNGSVTWYKLFV